MQNGDMNIYIIVFYFDTKYFRRIGVLKVLITFATYTKTAVFVSQPDIWFERKIQSVFRNGTTVQYCLG